MIEAFNIHKSFGSLEVLKGVDLKVEKGEVVAITGASGAGKTTLLQVLGTLSSPDSGTLSIDGTPVAGLSGKALSDFRCRRIGFVFQAHHLLPEFDAVENVMIPALIAGCPSSAARDDAGKMLCDLGLSDRLTHKPSQLSGGEQQRVAIARALINRPAVLFADEPTGNLDSKTSVDVLRMFRELNEKEKITIIIVTHSAEVAENADRSIRIHDGQIVDGIFTGGMA